MEDFVNDLGVSAFPHAIDASADIWQSFGVRSQPAFAFVNDDGTIGRVLTQSLGVAGLTAEVEDLIAR